MLVERIDPRSSWNDFVVIRLIRRWAAVRSLGQHALPDLVALAVELGEPPELAIGLHSLFQLTEACLARPLQAECCCSRELAADERAILTLLASARAGSLVQATRQIPHGLPAALTWAAVTAGLMLQGGVTAFAEAGCPFGHCR